MAEDSNLVRRRAYVKGLITQDVNKIKALKDDQLNKPLLEDIILKIHNNLKIVEEFDASLGEDLDEPELGQFLTSVGSYNFEVMKTLADLKLKCDSLFSEKKVSPEVNTKSVKLPLPPIQITPYENNALNPFAYFNFKKTFKNALAGMPNLTKLQKFVYLKGYLLGEALNVVENIPVTDDGYDLAFEQLDFNFLDVDNIVDKVLGEILHCNEAKSLNEVESLIRSLTNKIVDLKGLGVDLLQNNSASLLLVSKIINEKLPRSFLIELSRETGTSYPNFNQLANFYQSIISRLRLGQCENSGAKPKVKLDFKERNANSVHNRSSASFVNNSNSKTSYPNKEKHVPKVAAVGKCKFCEEIGHASSRCSKYDTLQARKNRAMMLGLCCRCLSNKHSTSECAGIRSSLPYKCFKCNKSEHHGAMCPHSFNLVPSKNVLNYQAGSDVFVPVLSLKVSRGKKSFNCSFLLDTGAQFSIINKQLIDSKLGDCCGQSLDRLVSSFGVPASTSKGFNFVASLTLPCGRKTSCLFFAMEEFKLSLQIPMLPSIVRNLDSAGCTVSPNYPGRYYDRIDIFGILGNDLLQDFKKFDLIHVELFNLNVKVIKLDNGIIPFGSVLNFIQPSDRKKFINMTRNYEFCEPCVSNTRASDPSLAENFEVQASNCKVKSSDYHKVSKTRTVRFSPPHKDDVSDNYNDSHIPSKVFYNSSFDRESRQVVKHENKIKYPEFVPPKQLGKHKLLVNFALNPVGHQFDPLQEIFSNASVEYGLDTFYNLESIGIKDESSKSYEDLQVEEFSKSISFYDGHYHVKLPWKEDLVKKVPSNLKVALAVAERVYSKLEDQNIMSDYEAVLSQQEALGIIEPVSDRVAGQVFIPHRPVIKTDEHTTTKIRPVFNCSLKVGKAPSLNEAAFPGVDLMNNLLSLLLYFRTNDYVVLADIMKAFLQIRLSSESDRNRFCFFRKINGKLVAYNLDTTP